MPVGPLAEGVEVAALGDAEACGGLGRRFVRWSGPARAEVTAVGGAEGQPARGGRVAFDLEVAPVVHPVVERAQAAQVLQHGAPAPGPVQDVVHVQPAALATARDATAPVTVLDQLAGLGVDGVLALRQGHDLAVLFEHDADGGVTGHVLRHPLAQRGAEVQVGGVGGVGIDVHVDTEALTGAPGTGVEVGKGGLGHAQEAVGPAQIARAGPARVALGVGVAEGELGVPGPAERRLEDGPLLGAEPDAGPEPAVLAVAEAHLPAGPGRFGFGLGFGHGDRAQGVAELGHGAERSQVGDLGVMRRVGALGDDPGLVLAERPGLEALPAPGELAQAPGRGHQRRCPGRTQPALPGEPVLGRADAHAVPDVGAEHLGHQGDKLGRGGVEHAHHRGDAGLEVDQLLVPHVARCGGQCHEDQYEQGV